MATQPERMRDHWWWRSGWAVGSRFYTWHLTFDGATEVHRLAADYRQALAPVPGLDLIPDQWLHLTMQGLGFMGEVPESEAHAIADAAAVRLADIPAFELTLGPAVVDPEAILLRVDPDEPVRAVRSAIRSAIADAWPEVPEPAEGFRPHVSVAYSNADGPVALVAEALARVPDPTAATRITHAELIILNRDHQGYEWETFAKVPLG